MNSVLERRKAIKFQFMEGLEEELEEEEDYSEDEEDEDSIQTASSSDIELSKSQSISIHNMGYATTLSPNSSLEIKRPDCKLGEDCSNPVFVVITSLLT